MNLEPNNNTTKAELSPCQHNPLNVKTSCNTKYTNTQQCVKSRFPSAAVGQKNNNNLLLHNRFNLIMKQPNFCHLDAAAMNENINKFTFGVGVLFCSVLSLSLNNAQIVQSAREDVHLLQGVFLKPSGKWTHQGGCSTNFQGWQLEWLNYRSGRNSLHPPPPTAPSHATPTLLLICGFMASLVGVLTLQARRADRRHKDSPQFPPAFINMHKSGEMINGPRGESEPPGARFSDRIHSIQRSIHTWAWITRAHVPCTGVNKLCVCSPSHHPHCHSSRASAAAPAILLTATALNLSAAENPAGSASCLKPVGAQTCEQTFAFKNPLISWLRWKEEHPSPN